MVKCIEKKVDVATDTLNNPSSFHWNGQWFEVKSILEHWKDTGTWWKGESEKTFYRVETPEGSLYELYQDITEKIWFLYRIYD